MRSAIFRFVVLTAVLLAVSLADFGQTPAVRKADGQMFAGETLVYDGKLKKFLRGLSIAELTFTATANPDSNELVVRSQAVSKGTLLKLFRYSFLQQYESTVDLGKFRTLKTTKHDVQKERVRDSEAIFDYEQKRVTFVETDPKDPMRPPRRIASEIGDEMYDMISAIYAVRLLPLVVGKRFEFSVSDSGLVYKVPFVVTGREIQDSVVGKKWCFKVEPEIFGTGRLIEQKGKMIIWMTDDDRHLPIKARVDSGYGQVDIKLKSATDPKKR